MSFKVVVDSGADLTPQMLKNPHFVKVPLTIRSNGSTFVDDASFDQADLLASMQSCKDAPSTACPSPQSYLDAYEGVDDVYVVTISALLSGSYNSAEQARRMAREEASGQNIHVFNSCSAVSGEALVALKALELAEKGLSFTEVVQETEHFIYEMQTVFVLESLENLRKNGRLTRMQSVITGALKIKLLLCATPEGEIAKLGQALSVKQALSKLVERISADPNHVGRKAGLCHCNCLNRAIQVKQMLEDHCSFSEILIMEAGGISTVYAYDGGIVVAY